MFEEEMKGVFTNDTLAVEEVVVGDISTLKQERSLIPPTKDVKFRIRSASVQANKDNSFRQIKLDLQIVDGIQVGEQLKFKNSRVFCNVTYYADPNKYTKEYFQKKQHLVQLKFLYGALGEDLLGVKINDAFLTSLNGRELLGSIKTIKSKDWVNNQGETVEGEMRNDVVNFKKSKLI
jgi:hypothetical protein